MWPDHGSFSCSARRMNSSSGRSSSPSRRTSATAARRAARLDPLRAVRGQRRGERVPARRRHRRTSTPGSASSARAWVSQRNAMLGDSSPRRSIASTSAGDRVAQPCDLVRRRPEEGKRDVGAAEVGRDVVDDVADRPVGREAHVAQVQLERLLSEHDLAREVDGRGEAVELGRRAREPHARRAAVAEQLLAGLAHRGLVERLARVDVPADGLVPAPAVLLVLRPALQEHLAPRVDEQHVHRADRQPRALGGVARLRADDSAGLVVDVQALVVRLAHGSTPSSGRAPASTLRAGLTPGGAAAGAALRRPRARRTECRSRGRRGPGVPGRGP